MKRRITLLAIILGIAGLTTMSWTLLSRAGYESASYDVIESDGRFEIRNYADLMLATTATRIDSQGRDGSFMRLFQFISGQNESEQKIAMTTPVFMEEATEDSEGSMGFVMPVDVTSQGVPSPLSRGVTLKKREGGRFAVVRFSGQLNKATAARNELELREWMKTRGLVGDTLAEAAGYDPPFTPGILRRNEVLVRLRPETQKAETES